MGSIEIPERSAGREVSRWETEAPAKGEENVGSNNKETSHNDASENLSCENIKQKKPICREYYSQKLNGWRDENAPAASCKAGASASLSRTSPSEKTNWVS